jgi:hypothetical protein
MLERMNRSPACCQRNGTRPARLAPLVWAMMLALGYLAACDSSEGQEGISLPTPTEIMVAVAEESPRASPSTGLSPSPTSVPALDLSPTAVPSSTETPIVAPTATKMVPSPTASTAAQVQEATQGPTQLPETPAINGFTAEPEVVNPGGTVTLVWEATGERATICPSARYVLFSADNCLSVPTAGTTTFTVPADVGGNHLINFILRVETSGAPEAAEWQVSVALPCEMSWFFDDEVPAGHCPTQPVSSFAAAQRFEHGTMIWLERPGRYYILDESTPYGDGLRRGLQIISDPLEIVGDSSGDVHPPDGLYAPQSGFGLVWRGDVTVSPGFREVLGWALGPEFGYDATLQCDDAPPSGGRSWQTCYLLGPAGEVIVLHPLGGWYLLDRG